KWDEATALALKIFSSDEKNFTATQKVTEALLESGQGERAMSVLSRIRIPMIDAGEHEGVVHLLNELATRLPGRLEPLEWLVDTYGRTSDSFRLPDALAHLGDALVGSGKLDRAKDVYEQLVEREPESDSAQRKLKDVMRKLGLLEPEPVAEAPEPVGPETLKLELPETPAPKVRPGLEETAQEVAPRPSGQEPAEPELDEETQKFIAQSLTDVDLFASYGLTQKAIGLLEAILRRAPTHTPTLEKLLDFVLGAGDDRRTAELAAQLEHIHAERGDVRSSERFGELRRRFQRAAGLTDDEIAAAVVAAMPQPVETVPVEEAATVVSAEGAEGFPIEASAEPVAEVAAPPVHASPVAQDAAAAVEEDVPEIEIIEPVPEVTNAQPVSASEEVDLSSEWASLLEETKEPEPKTKGVSPVPKVAAPSNVKEVELPDLVLEDETSVQIPDELLPHEVLVAPTDDIGNPQITAPADADNPEDWTSPLEEISSELPAPPKGVPAEPSTPAAGGIAAQHEELLPDEELTALPLPEHGEVAAEGPEPALELPQAALPKPLPPEPEFELEQEFELVIEPEPVVPAHEM